MDSDEVFRRAEARRAKILKQQQLRMNKILFGSRASDVCDHDNGETLEKEVLPERRTETFKDPPETELRHKKTDGPHFPRKVSLISSPADFKTVQQNQANKDGLLPVFIYSSLVSIHQFAYSLLPLLTLIFLAVMGSVKQYNFLIPFGTSQLIRIVHVVHNNPNGLTYKPIDVLSALAAHLIIFITLYIAVGVVQQQRVDLSISF